MKIYTVLLECGTVGTISEDTLDYQDADDFVGDNVTVHLHDENGTETEVYGKLKEVLE